ncbi:short-chain dehydrogenase/reductase SDR [Amycolatopsis mediterranei S699]|uniref:Short-chain dehydrogenase/reductase SDR n=2 Tax=Amycolatopsis mediterranei TaxID=33910 RepID=A0A0H3DD57_AMYMU|nr:SDR family NAD(P)-dependent oxidoreductase [Amycolatopsis mediterranei]ADJ48855.1 short-chain dehydrogenase/reductase SDR [Amycolatopsis mediterranei U32]AEK45803.1 short-chain dehydrogenase/reductase SDR [Amycolatopsis mediterranei S699]AFO80563.1 short-chain dehydrogenase/reductase SDR [Amycolatopsis mediterranei S699]AGT87691.1 short-chain dehydrogenase/reductase SDR [Amycolatopsis mediterranei RB]KDU94030.1 short-chain dehydrogenase [Amycolatopsis mediterranei]
MTEHRFDGRVAVVTGAGRGIGRAYAHLLGELGAKVVVNDLGGSMDGAGADTGPAHTVAREITDAGGTAIADTSDVSTVKGGATPIDLAVAEFGRVDVVVNNAGNVRFGGLPDIEVDNLDSHLGVHVRGAFNTSRAAWPHLLAQNYGRIVLTGSIGMFGLPDNLGYATAKAALLGMANSLTVSAGETDIKVNVILPNAMTRMGGGPSEGMDQLRDGRPEAGSDMAPSLVAPMVAYLAHENCDVSGQAYLAGGGRFAHLFVGVTEGYLPADAQKTTVDDVAEHLGRIKDPAGFYVPTSLMDCVGHYMSHR